MYTKKQRKLVLLACIVYISVIFLSSVFIVREADHDCVGEDCPICACIAQAEQTLKQLGTGKAETLAWLPAVVLLILVISYVFRFVPCSTLQSCKVRLND